MLGVVAACTAPPRGSPHPSPAVGSSRGGAASDRLGAFWIPTPRTMPRPYLRQIAGGVTWREAVWCDLEPRQGHWDWSLLDLWARQARRLGFTLMLKIRVGACWATRDGPRVAHDSTTDSLMPRSLAAYRRFVRAVVSRYASRGVHEYAVENEPNAINWWWAGSVDQLITLTRSAARTIRATDPDAGVVSWGNASQAYGVGVVARLLANDGASAAINAYRTYFSHEDSYPSISSEAELRDFLAGAQQQRDLAYLAAEERLLADRTFDVRQVHFYDAWESVPTLMAYLRATTPAGVPVEVWEAGQYGQRDSSDPRVRADQVVKAVALLLAGGARRVVWLPVTADPRFTGAGKGREQYYGLLRPGGGSRPAAMGFKQLVRWCAGASGAPVAVSGDGVHGVAFPHKGATALVVWADEGTAPVPTGGTARAWDVAGRAVRWPSSGLRVGVDPMFIWLQDVNVSRVLALLSG